MTPNTIRKTTSTQNLLVTNLPCDFCKSDKPELSSLIIKQVNNNHQRFNVCNECKALVPNCDYGLSIFVLSTNFPRTLSADQTLNEENRKILKEIGNTLGACSEIKTDEEKSTYCEEHKEPAEEILKMHDDAWGCTVM